MPKLLLWPGLCPGPCWGAYSAPLDPLAFVQQYAHFAKSLASCFFSKESTYTVNLLHDDMSAIYHYKFITVKCVGVCMP